MENEGEKLINAIQAELERRNLSIREFARLVGVSHPTISNILNGSKPTFELCEKLAPVLRISLVSVLYLAGLIPQTANIQTEEQQFLYLLHLMDETTRDELLAFMKFKLEHKDANNKATSRGKKPARSALNNQ
jgi:transcriptional regulator with XRE-family HTH domain